MDEMWLPSPVFGDQYQVSSLGRVRSARGIKSPYNDKDGYPTTNLHRGGVRRACTIHRLVCRAFHGEPQAPCREAAHLDGVRTNCRADNLKWVGKVQNHFHMRAHGTHQAGEQHGNAKLTEKIVKAIRAEANTDCAVLARRYGVSQNAIWKARNGRTWAHVSGSTAKQGQPGPAQAGCAPEPRP